MKTKKIFSLISNIFLVILIVIASLLLIRNTCYTAIIVSGESMYPTLKDKEYGYAVKTKYALNHIEHFDIIIFEYNNSKDIIKRVIGLPGETIEFKGDNCDLYINGEFVKQDFIGLEYQKVTLNNSQNYGFEKDKPFTIAANEYFVLGDNRGNSNDSLHGLGFVAKENIIGVLAVINSQCDNIYTKDERIVCEGKKGISIKFF